MPTILRENGFRVLVHGPPREHPPPHVHVEHGTSGLVVIRLRSIASPPRVWAAYDMLDRDVVRATRLVERHHTAIMQAWRAIHE